jgi:hypothetical protein
LYGADFGKIGIHVIVTVICINVVSSISCESNIDGEGKQKIQGHYFNFLFGGAKLTPTFKKKGGHTATTVI